MIKISARLLDIVSHVSKEDIIIDVGCDHALLAVYLVQKFNFKIIYVSDNKKEALKGGIENIEKNNLSKIIIPLLGNGLEVIKDENINTLIISGLGSRTILDIFDNNKMSKINKIIIQSNTELYSLRKEVVKAGYKIIKETIIYDNKKYYSTMSFIRGSIKYQERYLKFGFHQNIEYYNYLIEKKKKLMNQHLTNI